MAAAVEVFRAALAPPAPEPFIDKHFAKIAFAVSALALFLIAAPELVLGAVIGFALHSYMEPTIGPDEKVVTIANATFTIVGAVAALIRFSPAAAAGGLLFFSIPFFASLAVGATLHRAYKLGI
ncbi:MAG TPA: hypothetical protein VLF94_05410 [Chlamydiales bacterium]|nr:hypothetical protein [Chlamydiales bacterium]